MSKVQFYFDKKQFPQVVGLGALSVGLLGYFAVQILTPPPAQRARAESVVVGTSIVKDDPEPAVVEMGLLTNGLAPSLSMHDPFIPLLLSQSQRPQPTRPMVQTASLQNHFNALTPPFSGDIKPLAGLTPGLTPLAIPAPPVPWTVTGVLAGSAPGNDIAVLRNGDSRRFVALGDMVDDQYRLIGINRFGVTLGLGKSRFRLKLGEDPAAASPHVGPTIVGTPQLPALTNIGSLPTITNQIQ
jgi:hypothetical protein